MKKLLDATTEDLAGIYKELAETVGIDNAHEIYLHFKGMQMMFPRRFYSPIPAAKNSQKHMPGCPHESGI